MRTLWISLGSKAIWTIYISSWQTKGFLFILISAVVSLELQAKGLDFAQDAMCIPAGDKIWLKLGINSDISEYITTKKIHIGPAKIPKGCKITFGYSSELASSSDLKEIAEKRTVSGINGCQFEMAGTMFMQGSFDLEGCMDGIQIVTSKKKLCKELNPNYDIGQYYFDGGFLRCDHKFEEP